MARWVVLFGIELDEGTIGFSNVDVATPEIFFEPLVSDFGQVSRSVPVVPGALPDSSLTIRLSNRALYFSQAIKLYQFRGREAWIKIALEDTAYADADTHFTGKIAYRPSVRAGSCEITVQDKCTERWKRPVDNAITKERFPNLPDSLLADHANIVIGKVDSTGKTDQGFIPCQLIDTSTNTYLICCHPMREIIEVYVPAEFSDAEWTDDLVELPDGRLWHVVNFNKSVESTSNAGEFSVAVDGEGLHDYGGDEHLFTNPAEVFKQYNLLIAGFEDAEFDSTTYTATYNAKASGGYFLGGIIKTGDITHEQVLSEILKGGSIEVFKTSAGLIALNDFTVETASVGDPSLDHEDDVQMGSLAFDFNRVTINKVTLHYDYDAIAETFTKEPPALENLASQDDLTQELLEDMALSLVSDDATALRAAALRLYWTDEDRVLVQFELSQPATPAGIDLTNIFKLTHFEGLSDTMEGWIDESFKALQMVYQLNGTPKIQVMAISIAATDNTFPIETPPGNVTIGSITESAAGIIHVPWTLPGSNIPTKIKVFVIRVEDELRTKKYCGIFTATDLLADFEVFYPESGNLYIFLVPVSSTGAERELDWMIDSAHDTTTAEAIDLTEKDWQVAATTDLSNDDYIMTGREINRILSRASNPISLYNSSGVRTVYEGRARALHANGAQTGKITPTVAYGTDSSRRKITTISSLTGYASGQAVVLRWSPLTNPNDLTMFRNFEIYRGTTTSFASAEKIAGFVLSNIVGGYEVYIDRDAPDEQADFYYWVTSRTIYGVLSTESNRVGTFTFYPFPLASTVHDFDVVAQGDTFKASWSGIRDATSSAIVITDASNTSPIEITTQLPHAYVTGDFVHQTGIAGLAGDAANGDFRVTVVDELSYSLDGTTGSGAYSLGGLTVKLVPVSSLRAMEIAYRELAWVNESSPDDDDVTRVLLPGGTTEKEGKLPESTLYWAIRARLYTESQESPASIWNIKAASVTSGAEVGYVHVDRLSHYGEPGDEANNIAFDLDLREFRNPPWGSGGGFPGSMRVKYASTDTGDPYVRFSVDMNLSVGYALWNGGGLLYANSLDYHLSTNAGQPVAVLETTSFPNGAVPDPNMWALFYVPE